MALTIMNLSHAVVRAADKTECADTLKELTPEKVLERLKSLPPIALDTPTVREAIARLINDLKDLHPMFQEVRSTLLDLMNGRIDLDTAIEKLQSSQERITKTAAETLAKSDPNNPEVRRLLEGLKILLNDTQGLKKQLQDYKENPEKLKDDQQKQKEENERSQEEQDSDGDQDGQQQDGQKGDKSQNNKKGKKQKSDKNSKEQSEDQDESADGDKDGDSDQKGDQGNESEDGQQGQKGQKSKQGQKGQKGKSGEPDQDGEDSDSGDAAEGQSQSSKQSQKPSQSSGKSKSDNGSSDQTLNQLLEQLRQELDQKRKAKGEKIEEEKDQGDPSKENGEDQNSGQNSAKSAKEAIEKLKKPDPLEPRDESQRRQPPPPKQNSELPKPTDLEQSEILKAMVKQMFAHALRQYGNSDRLTEALRDFEAFCRNADQRIMHTEFIESYVKRAAELQDELDNLGVRYADLEVLGLSVTNGGGRRTDVRRKVEFLDKLFKELQNVTQLTSEEQNVHDIVKILSQVQNQSKDDGIRTLVDAFLAKLTGPLSRRLIRNIYADASGRFDMARLLDDLKHRRLDNFLFLSRLKKYLNILLRRTNKPAFDKHPRGKASPMNEYAPELVLAQEIDELQHFYRDGIPPKEDAARVMSGDMLKYEYRDPKIVENPKHPFPKEITVILIDVSGSMDMQHKWVVRDGLVAAYVDRSQIPVASRSGEHTVVVIPFHSEVGTPEKLKSLKEALEYFERHMKFPKNAGGGTDITKALVEVYRMIAEAKKGQGELQRANILLLTDAEDSIDRTAIDKAAHDVGPEMEVFFSSIILGTTNEHLKKLVKDFVPGRQVPKQHLFYQEIGFGEITDLVNHDATFDAFLKAAEKYSTDLDRSLDPTVVMRLKDSLVGLAARKRMREQSINSQVVINLRQALSQEPVRQDAVAAEKLMKLFLTGARSSISAGWSENLRAYALDQYLEACAQVLKSSKWDVLAALPMSMKNELRLWVFGK
ncbi:MAG: VWA domain-containing protein [Oligoflexia bacterium]|nr:VWA domain-containing protein [Oligoflexia bacterium]